MTPDPRDRDPDRLELGDARAVTVTLGGLLAAVVAVLLWRRLPL